MCEDTFSMEEACASLSLQVAEERAKLQRSRSLLNTASSDVTTTNSCSEGSHQQEKHCDVSDHFQADQTVKMTDEKNLPCIFELRKVGLCLRQGKCKYDHDFNPELRADNAAFTEVFVETSRRLGKCAFEMTERGSCPGEPTCKVVHCKPIPPEERSAHKACNTRVCFRELTRKGSCHWGEYKCRFSHKISASQREDTEFIQEKIQEKNEKASKCIYEFRFEGACKNKDFCPFSHAITNQDREDNTIKKNIQEKLAIMKNKQQEVQTQKPKTGGEQDQGKADGVVVSKEIAALRQEFHQLKQMMLNKNNP